MDNDMLVLLATLLSTMELPTTQQSASVAQTTPAEPLLAASCSQLHAVDVAPEPDSQLADESLTSPSKHIKLSRG